MKLMFNIDTKISAIAVAALILMNLIFMARSTLISSGSIEQCLDYGDTDTDTEAGELDCETKAVVTLTLSGEQGEVEYLETTLSSVSDGSQEIELENPWTISVSKSPVYVQYPLEYVQSFNGNPTEGVVKNIDKFQCSDTYTRKSQTPTCGIATSSEGSYIDGSEGFCCECGVSAENQRGLTCSGVWDWGKTQAHCLSFDDNKWYAGYDIGNYELQFEINVTIERLDENGEQESLQFSLSPSNTAATTKDLKIAAKLVGDLFSYEQIDDFGTEYLFVPATGSRASKRSKNSMIIPKTEVTLDGLECDKIGVSYSAFQNQANRCSSHREVGDCLTNQLDDYHENGENFASSWGSIDFFQDDEEQVYLRFEKESKQTSVISFSISTEDIRFVKNVADGHIDSCEIEDFEALSDSGKLECSVVNDGNLEAMFRLSVVNCTNGILAVQEQEKSISSLASEDFSYEIESSTVDFSEHYCDVNLYNSVEQLIDSTRIEFSTTAVEVDLGAQGGNGPEAGSSEIISGQQYSCLEYCEGFFDIFCLLGRNCWSEIWTAFWRLVLGTILLLFLIKKAPTLLRCLLRHTRSASAAAGRSKLIIVRENENENKNKSNKNNHVVIDMGNLIDSQSDSFE